MKLSLCIGLAIMAVLVAGCGGGGGKGGSNPTVTGSAVVLGYNDLGMHCINQDFSEIIILPPANNLHAQIIDRSGEDPRIITGGVTVNYSIPGNTTSADKTNFWTYASSLLGTSLAPNVGITGNGLSGQMSPTGTNDWAATAIPVTELTDSGQDNPYQLASITVTSGGSTIASTQAVVPVSWEMSCNLCHKDAGVSTATSILRAHDRLHGTNLVNHKPVVCSSCHADPVLNKPGHSGLPSLSSAMHGAHASRMSEAGLDVSCYACHPGVNTRCLRDVHFSHGMTCDDCHGTMTAVANPSRTPWADEPKCGSSSCHHVTGHEYEQANTLYRDSKGHHGVHCEACHGSPHAILPTVVQADNVQSIAVQGHAGKIDKCTVCHKSRPDDGFGHRLSGGD